MCWRRVGQTMNHLQVSASIQKLQNRHPADACWCTTGRGDRGSLLPALPQQRLSSPSVPSGSPPSVAVQTTFCDGWGLSPGTLRRRCSVAWQSWAILNAAPQNAARALSFVAARHQRHWMENSDYIQQIPKLQMVRYWSKLCSTF